MALNFKLVPERLNKGQQSLAAEMMSRVHRHYNYDLPFDKQLFESITCRFIKECPPDTPFIQFRAKLAKALATKLYRSSRREMFEHTLDEFENDMNKALGPSWEQDGDLDSMHVI